MPRAFPTVALTPGQCRIMQVHLMARLLPILQTHTRLSAISTDNVNAWLVGYEKVVARSIILSLECQEFKVKELGLTNLASDNLGKTYMIKLEYFY